MTNELTVLLPQEVEQIAQSVSTEKRNEVQSVLNNVFSGVAKMREQLDSVVVSDENDKVNMKLANTIRLGVRQVRLDAEKTFDAKRQEVQLQMLSFKTEDSLWLKAKQTMQILTKEIEEQARFKEETRQRFEAEQKELNIQQRILKVSKFNDNINRLEFENMSDDMFNVFLSGIEKVYNDKIESEKKAEEDRIAKEKEEAEERERIRIENEKLKAEAEAKEVAMAKERAMAEAQRKAIEDKLKAEQEASKIAAQKAEQERLRLELEIKAKADDEAKIQAQKAAEEKAQRETEAKAAKAPKKQKLNNWINDFNIVSPVGLNEDETVLEIIQKFEAFKNWAKQKIDLV